MTRNTIKFATADKQGYANKYQLCRYLTPRFGYASVPSDNCTNLVGVCEKKTS